LTLLSGILPQKVTSPDIIPALVTLEVMVTV